MRRTGFPGPFARKVNEALLRLISQYQGYIGTYQSGMTIHIEVLLRAV